MSEISWDNLSPDEVPDFAPASEEPPTRPAKAVKSPKTRKPSKPAPPAKKGKYVEPLKELYGFVGIGVSMVDSVCGTAILESAERCAESVDELAYKNPAVRRVVESITQTSAVGAVVAAHLPIVLAVAAHHGGALFGDKVVEAEIVDNGNVSAS